MDMAEPEVVWQPQDGPQTEFHMRSEFEVLYGGARGGGKTDALIVEGLRQVEIPTYKALFLRRTYPQLEEVLDRAHYLIPRLYPKAKWNGEHRRFTFPSGAIYRFGHVQQEGDQRNYQGHQYAYIAFDELTHFTESMYLDIMGSCRTSDPRVEAYMRSSANPGGVGHAWVKERFVDTCPPVKDGPMRYIEELGIWWQPMKPGKRFVDPDSGLDRIFVPSRVFDNKALLRADPAYIRRLLAQPEDVRRAWLEGDWDVFAGRVYPEFHMDTHVVEPWEIPEEWPKIRVIDTGYTNPTAVLWGAVDPDGRLIVYAEHYEAEKPISYHIEAIWRIQGEKPWTGISVMDPAADQRTAASEKSAMMQYADAERWGIKAVRAQKANNAVWPGIQKVKDMLQIAEDGFPRLFIFSNCTNLIREIRNYQWDPNATAHGRPKETPLAVNDHAVDALRYMVMHMPSQSYVSDHRRYRGRAVRRRTILSSAAGY